jgi:hypothetical protein
MLEEQSDKELASILGISYDELCQLEWDVDTNESSVQHHNPNPNHLLIF